MDVPWEEIDVMWPLDYYDGLLSGMAMLHGQEVYLHCESEDDDGNRIFGIYVLTEDQLAAEKSRHDDFVRFVGGGLADWRTNTPLQPRSEWDKFYDKYKREDREDYRKTAKKIATSKY